MADNFTREDWYHVRSHADLMAVRLRAKGLRTFGITPLPAVDRQQGREFYQATGKTLPLEFINLTTKYTGGWSFEWSLSTDDWGFDVEDAPADSGCTEDFIGVTEKYTILSKYRQLQDQIPEKDRSDQTPFLFPLSLDGSGDYLALRFDCSPTQVIILDHEAGYDVTRARVLSHGFTEFVRSWATLGFPAWEQLDRWMPRESQQLSDSDHRAKSWLDWLADPTARSQ